MPIESLQNIHAQSESMALSERQSLLWLDAQLFPSSHTSNLILLMEVRGSIERDRMRRAWSSTATDFDALGLEIHFDAPSQIWGARIDQELQFVTLESQDQVAEWTADRSAQDLGPGRPLWEAVFLSAGRDFHVLYVCQHHIISDGLSMLNLVDRLSSHYLGTPTPAPPTFHDYIQSEFTYRASAKAEKDRAYWTHYLENPPAPIELYGQMRTDASIGLSRIWTETGTALSKRLTDTAKSDYFSCFSPTLSRLVTIATGLVAFLSRASGNTEILLGIPYGNRSRRFQKSYGLIMEQTFIRVQVEPGQSYASLAEAIKHELLNGIRHGRGCVSDHGLQYATLNLLPAAPALFGNFPAQLQIGPAPTRVPPNPAASSDLRDTFGIQLHDFEDGPLRIAFDFHAGTFNKAVQEKTCDHFNRVLEAMTQDPMARIDALSLMSQGERQQVIEMGRGHEPQNPPLDIIEQFTLQLKTHSEKTAIHAPDHALTYTQLDCASTDLAQTLVRIGLRPGDRAALAMPRGALEVVAMLAVLKAGGVYVPIDSHHPASRVQAILKDAHPEFLIAPSHSRILTILPEETHHFALDQVPTSSSEEKSYPLPQNLGSNSLAYILFTSGTTGRPKGVAVPRSALANFLRSMAHTPGMRDNDHLLAVTTTTFDISGLELLLPLWTGGSVTIADRDTAADPRALSRVLDAGEFSLMQATPATWRMLLNTGWRGSKNLRILCGGEALSPELAESLLPCGSELWNLYGPTETTIWSSATQVEPHFDKITIGRPIDNTQILILDSRGELAPPGVVGEIYIGGAGLAEGYFDQPELTENAFISGLVKDPAERLYCTGDMGRLLPDGRFECLGRTDHQVKIRGFRIELGEIESVLHEHSGVDAVLATANRHFSEEPTLAVYWIGAASQADLHALARENLPHYMLPSAYMRLDAFPLNTSGKIDRRSLPEPIRASSDQSSTELPHDDNEVRLAGLWKELLGVTDVGRNTNFFSAGGTSIRIIDLRDRAEEEFDTELSLRACFDHPTIAGLARQLEEPCDSQVADSIVSVLRPGDSSEPQLFCLYGIHLYQDLALAMPETQPVIGMHIPISYDPASEDCPTVSDAAHRYVTLIRQHQPKGPYRLAGLCFGGLVAYEAARQLETAGEKVELIAIFDTRLPQSREIRRLARVRSLARFAMTQPGPALERLWNRIVRHKRPSTDQARTPEVGLQELPIRGERVEEQARAYADHANPVDTRVLLFRATKEPDPEWLVYDHDFGWSSLATQVAVFDIPGKHLEIIQSPHCEVVATEIEKAFLKKK